MLKTNVLLLPFLLLSVFALAACGGSDTTAGGDPPVIGTEGPGLGAAFNVFDAAHDAANLVFYVDVRVPDLDTTVDNPTPSATVDAVAETPCVVTVSNSATGAWERWRDTVIRYKGNTTFDANKRQYKLKFTKANQFHGIRRLNIHSEWKDATLMHEKLVYDFMNAVGVVAPRANHVRVYLKNTASTGGYVYQGLYTAVEQVDKYFLKNRYGALNGEGNLYKAYYGVKGSGSGFANLQVNGAGNASDYRGGNGWASDVNARAYRLETNEDLQMENYADLAALINSIATGGTGLESSFNVTGFLKWLAANTLVGGWDNYWANCQNYYLYKHNGTGLWQWIAWDYDNSMGNQFQHGSYQVETEDIYYTGWTANTLIHKVLAVPAWKTAYTNYLKTFMDSHFNSTAINARVDNLKTKLQAYVEADTLKWYNNTQWLGNLDSTTMVNNSAEEGDFGNHAYHLGIKNYVALRTASVAAQLGLGGGGFAKNYNQMYLRGTVNSWNSTAMNLVADNTWQITLSMLNLAEFKFDDTTTWTGVNWGEDVTSGYAGTCEANSANNIINNRPTGAVTVTFNDSTLAWSVTP